MASVNFEVKNGLTAGSFVINAVSNTTTFSGNFDLSGPNVSLGAISNLHVTGGSNGYSLLTDGAGNLSFGNVIQLVNGSSNVVVAQNGSITIGASGNSFIMTVSGIGMSTIAANVSGNTTLGANSNSLVTVNSNVTMLGDSVGLGTVANLHIDGGSSGQYLRTDGNGNLSWATVSGSGLSNGNSNIAIAGNGNVTVSVAGNSNVLTVTGTGITTSNVSSASNLNLIAGGTGNAVVITTNGNSTSFLANGGIQPSGAIMGSTSNGTLVDVTQGPLILQGSYSGAQIQVSGDGNVANGGTWYFNANGNITSPKSLLLTGDISAANVATTGLTANGNVDLTGANVSLGAVANLHITGGSNLQFLQTNGSGNLTWATVSSSSLENGNSNVVVAANANVTIAANGNTIFTATGSGNGNLVLTGIVVDGYITANGKVTGNIIQTQDNTAVRLGAAGFWTALKARSDLAANYTLTMPYDDGSTGQVLTTDGSGNLSWATTGASIANGTSGIAMPAADGNINLTVAGNANVAVVTGTGINVAGYLTTTATTTAGNLTTGGNLSVTGNTTLANANVGNLSATGNISGNFVGNINTTTTIIGNGLQTTPNASVIFVSNVSGTLQQVQIKASTDANFSGNYSLTLPVDDGTAGQFLSTDGSGILSWVTPSGSGNTTASNLVVTVSANFVDASNVSLGAVANVHISGGTNGQVLTTDGSGALSWTTVSGGSITSITNGNSNVVVDANANVTISVAGNSNIITVTGTGANIAGTANITGNTAVGGNLNVTSNLTAGNLNITGTVTKLDSLVNGNSNIVITANSDITFTVAGNTPPVLTVTNDVPGSTVDNPGISVQGTIHVEQIAGATIMAEYIGNVNNSLYFYLQNYSDQPNASTDLALYSDIGTASEGYVDIGIVSSTYNQSAYSILAPEDSYLLAVGNSTNGHPGNLILATQTSNSSVVKISGGARLDNATAVLTVTNTAANISGTLNITGNATAPNFVGTLANGTSNVAFASSGGNINMTVGGTTTLVVAGTSANITGNLNVSGNIIGNVTGNVISGNLINGNSNVIITANANVTVGVAGNAAILTVTGTGANITGTANISSNLSVGGNASITSNLTVGNISTTAVAATGNINFTGANVSLGAVANLHITGGSNTQVLSTDGSGNLSWVTVSSTSLANGNSNITIASNANITISSAGNANILTITGTGANIAGTANITGALSANSITASGLFNIQGGVSEEWQSPTIGSTVTMNIANGMVAYISSITQAFTLDVVGTSALGNANAITVAVIGAPSSGSYFPSNVTIDGGSPLTLTWAGGTPANLTTSTYAFEFNILKSGTSTATKALASWTLYDNSAISTISGIANGTSNLNIPTSNGNLYFGANGTANVMIVTATDITVPSNLTLGTSSLATRTINNGANTNQSIIFQSGGAVDLWFGNTSNAAQYRWSWQDDRNVVLYAANGTPIFTSNTATSDLRLKDWAMTVSNGTAVIKKLDVIDFTWKENTDLTDGGKTHTGFGAQHVEPIIPDAVKTFNDTKLLDKGELIPFLTKALQESITRIEVLEAQVRELMSKITPSNT